mgnify:CR=1 FL=1
MVHTENPLLENREEQELGNDIERDLHEVHTGSSTAHLYVRCFVLCACVCLCVFFCYESNVITYLYCARAVVRVYRRHATL